MAIDLVSMILANDYTEESLLGGGAVVGKNVTISSITPIDGGNRVTFSYTLDNGTVKTSTMDVMDGVDGLPGKNGKDGSDGADGLDGVGISKIEKIGTVDLVDTYRITFTDGSTFDYEVKNGKDGSGSEGGEANTIDSISVNGVNVSPDENKNVDITVPSTEGLASETWVNEQGFLTEHQDISGKVDKVDGKSLIADAEIERLASVDNYDDTQVKSQIQAVANGLMDSVGYSADYKTIDIIAKNGVKKSVNVAPIISHASITELSDVDTTNKATGKALVYNATTSKHEYEDVSGTDEKVKMDASTDAKYLGELLDNVTIANENGELKVKKLDGQEVTITEINYLKGLTMNVMDLVNMFSNGGVKIINTPVATYAELLTLDKSSFIEGISYLVYVLADENHDNAKTTYLVDKDSETPTYFGFADSQRDFTTNPIDLANEITGKLGIANMDSDAIKALFTVDDTYKTETATNNAFSTHGAKALYDELLLAIGNKANDSDLTAHENDTDIHVSTEDRTKWDSAKTHADSAHAPSNAQENVLETVKVNGTALEVSDKAVNVTVPTKVSELTDSTDYAKTADIPTTLPASGGNADTVNNHTVETDVPVDAVFTDTVYDDTEVKKRIFDNGYGEVAGGKNLLNYNIIDSKIKNCSILFKDDTFYATNKGNYSHFVLSVPTLVGKSYTVTIKDWSDYSYRCIASVSDLNDNTLVSTVITDATLSMTFTAVGTESLINISPNNTANEMSNTITFKCMLEEGSVATDYEPYFQSNKMLASESVHQRTEAMDLKMLGWTVPSECPVQNYVDGDGVFHQRVGRVDLGSLEWTYDTLWKATSGVSTIKNLTINMYHSVYSPTILSISDIPTNSVKKADSGTLWINNGSSTEKPSGYLYFELAEEKTIKVDGNECTERINDSLSVIGKCKNLLNTTLQTTTMNGIECTNNGDGTYTLNGTVATGNYEQFTLLSNKISAGTYKLVGNPDYSLGCSLYFSDHGGKEIDYGNGGIVNFASDITTTNLYLYIPSGVTLTNVVFKPMLTTNLNATYDDFVPYTGDGETLTHDVAKVSDSLDAQGLLNKFDGDLLVGKVYASSDGSLTTNYTYVCNRNKIYCYENDIVHIRTKNTAQIIALYYNENEYISYKIVNSNQCDFIVPSGTTYMNFDIQDNTLSPSDIHIYINNEIEQIKNELSVKKFELVAGVLWLCVSGKHCVLTLNGYNLTEPTHFDKLEEYQPYLVARNVVSKEDGVCIFSVDPDGNVGASDLQVASSVTGKMFGEVSWVANI